jgi:methyl-accepting chemotaxis protein
MTRSADNRGARNPFGTVRRKILASFAIVLLLLGLVSAVAWQSVASMGDEFDRLYSDNLEGAVHLSDAQSALWELRYGFPQFMVATNLEDRQKILAAEPRLYETIDAALASYGAGNRTAEERDALTAFEAIFKQYKDARPRWFELYGSGLTVEAAAWRAETTTPFGKGSVDGLAGLIQLQRTVATEARDRTVASVQQTELLVAVLFATGFGVALVVALWLSRHIVRRIQVARTAAAAIAAGEIEGSFDTGGRDEIGDLTRSFGEMTTYLQAIAAAAEAVARNDLTVDIEPKSERDVLGRAFATMTPNLRGVIGDLKAASASVAHTSSGLNQAATQSGIATQQVATTIQQVAAGAQDQARAASEMSGAVSELSDLIARVGAGAAETTRKVELASATIGQMTAAISDASAASDEVSEVSATAAEAASNGLAAVAKTADRMALIKSAVDESSVKVTELGAKGEQIGAIVETINDIAEQTNLLALNAAIEAARAGEMGKGFAVVADEVRKLAERSGRATKEIATLIAEVQAGTEEAVKAMTVGAAEVQAGAQLAVESKTALDAITTAVAATKTAVGRISASVTAMSRASAGVVGAIDEIAGIAEGNNAAGATMTASATIVGRSVDSIAAVSEQNSAAADEVSVTTDAMSAQAEEVVASAESLAEMAAQLDALVASFRLDAGVDQEAADAPSGAVLQRRRTTDWAA